jgi:beta-glucanase (GH16 family)
MTAVIVVSDACHGARRFVPADGIPPTVSGPPAGARLVFSDEFSGTRLDPTKWITCYPWAKGPGCTNPSTAELEWYEPQGASVSGGLLHLTAQRRDLVVDRHTYAYESGMVASAGAFQFTYGYVEFRARVPQGRGLWPALWLLPTDGTWPPEIDVLEVQGAKPGVAVLTYHPASGRQEQHLVRTPDLSGGWHVFAIDWRPGSIVWYLDGSAAFQVTAAVASQPMYLLMDLAVSGTQPPTNATRFPASLDVDYVRVWQPG